MNRQSRRKRSRLVCEAEVAFTDFDGTRTSAPCGWPATQVVTFFTQQGWLTGSPRTADTLHACDEHAAEALSQRDYGVEAVISRPLAPLAL